MTNQDKNILAILFLIVCIIFIGFNYLLYIIVNDILNLHLIVFIITGGIINTIVLYITLLFCVDK